MTFGFGIRYLLDATVYYGPGVREVCPVGDVSSLRERSKVATDSLKIVATLSPSKEALHNDARKSLFLLFLKRVPGHSLPNLNDFSCRYFVTIPYRYKIDSGT